MDSEQGSCRAYSGAFVVENALGACYRTRVAHDAAERAAREFIDGVLVPGGRIVVHDYGYFSSGVETSVNEFLASRPDR